MPEDREMMCSFEAPTGSMSLKWFVCPHTPEFCGTQELFIGDTWKGKIMPRGYYADYLKDGAACRYEIKFPKDATSND